MMLSNVKVCHSFVNVSMSSSFLLSMSMSMLLVSMYVRCGVEVGGYNASWYAEAFAWYLAGLAELSEDRSRPSHHCRGTDLRDQHRRRPTLCHYHRVDTALVWSVACFLDKNPNPIQTCPNMQCIACKQKNFKRIWNKLNWEPDQKKMLSLNIWFNLTIWQSDQI